MRIMFFFLQLDYTEIFKRIKKIKKDSERRDFHLHYLVSYITIRLMKKEYTAVIKTYRDLWSTIGGLTVNETFAISTDGAAAVVAVPLFDNRKNA